MVTTVLFAVMDRSDREILAVFANNLQQLILQEKSISALCRVLRVNRSQFNRYLSGEAFPRPLVLHRICAYFNVDARILFEPLSDDGGRDAKSLSERIVGGWLQTMPVPRQDDIEDGVYNCWGYSILWPGCVFRNQVIIFSQNGVRRTRTRVPWWSYRPGIGREMGTFYVLDGVVFKQLDGLIMFERIAGQQPLHVYVFRHGYTNMEGLFAGLRLMGSTPHPALQFGVVPVLFERLPAGYSSIRRAAKQPRLLPENEAPAFIRNALKEISRFAHIDPNHQLWRAGRDGMPPSGEQ